MALNVKSRESGLAGEILVDILQRSSRIRTTSRFAPSTPEPDGKAVHGHFICCRMENRFRKLVNCLSFEQFKRA
jgi:hypothetical protein